MPARFVTLGRYVPGQSHLHQLDARVKLVVALAIASASVACWSWRGQTLIVIALLGAFAGARLPAGVLGRALRAAVWLLAFVTGVNLVWGLVIRQAAWAPEASSVQTVAALVVLLLRLVNLLLLGVLLTSTSIPVDIAEGLERLAAPLKRLRIPVHEFGMLLVMALSFIPVLLDEAQHLVDAARIKRGTARWGFWPRLRAAVPLLVPLFLSVLRRSDELAVALDARCFVPGARRTSWVAPRAGKTEYLALLICALVLLGVWRL